MKILSQLKSVRACLLFLGLTAAFAATSQAQTAPPLELYNNISTLLPNGGTANFSRVKVNTSIHYLFRLRNSSQAPVTVTFSKSGPQEADFTLSQLTTTLPPHANITDGFNFNVALRSTTVGTQTATLRIETSDPAQSPFEITLQGEVVNPKFQMDSPVGKKMNPGQTWDFGYVDLGHSESLTYTIRNVGETDLRNIYTGFTNNTSHYAVTQAPASTVPPGGSTTVTVTFAPTVATNLNTTLYIYNSDVAFPVNFTGTGAAPELLVRSKPENGPELPNDSQFDFGAVHLGTGPAGKIFQIANVGTGLLTGLSLGLSGENAGDFTIATVMPEELDRYGTTSIILRFLPSATGIRTATLTLTSNDADENTFRIQLTGEGSLPEIAVESLQEVDIPSDSPYDFGEVEVRNDKKSRYVRLWNRGIGPLVINQLYLDSGNAGEFFTGVPATPFSIPAGQYQQVEMGFDPSNTGLKASKFVIFSNDLDERLYNLPLTGTGIQPEMVVEQPPGTPIPSQQTRQIGVLGIGTNIDLPFTLKNPGTAPLRTQISLVGPHAAQFSLVDHPLQTIYPGETKVITVRYSPATVGAHQVTLRIASNLGRADPDPLFDIHLKGTGEQTVVSFKATSYQAVHGAPTAFVTVKRSPANLAASVFLDTSDGPAQSLPPFTAAVAGTDYTDLAGSARVVSFSPGQSEETVQVPLLVPASGAEQNRQLTLTLSKDAHPHSTAIGTPATAILRIVGKDEGKPTLQLTSPAAGARFSLLSPAILVSGRAGDPKGIDRIEVTLNAGSPVPVSVSGATSSTSVPFSISINPVSGQNQVIVTAYDPKGNSTSVSRSFTYERRRPFTLYAHEMDHPESQPTATVAVNGGAVPLSSEAPGGVVKPASVLPGTRFTLTCTPKLPNVLNQWSFQPVPADLQISGNTCTFTMPDADLVVRALTIASPFVPPPGGSNRIHLVINDDLKDGAESRYKAHLIGTLTPAGSFTGKVFIGGQNLAVTAAILTQNSAIFTVGGKKQESLAVPGGTLRLHPSEFAESPFKAVLTPEENSAVPDLTGHAHWGAHSTTRPLPQGLQTQADGGGMLSVSLAPPVGAGTAAISGYGYASINLTKTGIVTLTGALADGTAITMSSDLLEDFEAPLFVQLPTPGASATTKDGLLIGRLRFNPTAAIVNPPQPANLTAALRWFRPAAASPKVLLFPQSWPLGADLTATGAKYDSRLAYNVGLDLATAPTNTPNASLRFSGGGYAIKLINTFNLMKTAVSKIPSSDSSYTLTISPATGLFSGTFTPVGAPAGTGKPAFRGILLNRAPFQFGHGFFLNHATPASATAAGSVILGKP